MPQYGKCTNIGNCTKANTGELMTVIDGVEFICPECSSNLNPALPPSNNRIVATNFSRVIAITALLGFVGGIFNYFLGNQPQYTLKVSKAPQGTGKGELEIVDERSYRENETVNLSAKPDSSSIASWSPAPCAENFSMPNSDLECKVIFNLKSDIPSKSPTIETPMDTQKIELQIEQHQKQGMGYINSANQTTKSNLKIQQFNNAISELTQAIRLSKESSKSSGNCQNVANVYMNRGLAYLEINNPNIAIEDLKEAAECDPHNGMIQYNLAYYYAVIKQDDFSLRALDTSLRVKDPINEIFSRSNRSFCDELKDTPAFTNIRKKPQFKVVLEKYKLFCSNL